MKDPPPAPFEIIVRVESDPGTPVVDAVIMKGGKEGPHTGPDGKVDLKIGGKEGETVDLMVRCPAEYVTVSKPLTVLLRRISGGKLPEYPWICAPTMRNLVVAVRADNGPNLPITSYGKVIGRTDASGAFTWAFKAKPGDGVELILDTSEPGNERIHPKMPSGTFTVKAYDDVVTFDQRFKWDPPPVHYVAPKLKPQPILPKRLDYSQ